MASFPLEPLQVTSRKDAFISYSRGDSLNFAIKLQENLTEKDFKVWFDKQDIAPSVDWQEAINRGIESADNFIFILAPKAVKSEYCGLEIDHALKYNKRLIPLVHVEFQDCWDLIPPALSKIDYIWFREDQDNFEESFNRLLSSLNKHKDDLELHTDILLQALEWERNQKQTHYLLIGEQRTKAETWLKQTNKTPIIPTDLHCEFISESRKNANNLMTQVFLSFSEQDEEIKEKIRKILLRECLTIWTNKTDIKAGKKFLEAIKKGIEGADSFIYLISSSSLKSEYCQQELDLAFSYNKRIIPLLIESLEPDSIPERLRGLQFIDFTTDNLSSVERLLGELKKEPSYYEKQKILLVKALKWSSQNQNPSLLLRGYNLQQFEAWLKVAQKREDYPPLPLQEDFITASQNKSEESSLDVFISYSRSDSDLARKLNDELQEVGKTTWFDQESIATGEDFKIEIERGIKNSDNFVFIISPKSVNSPYCVEEVEYAQKLNKRFITILYRKLSEDDRRKLPAALATVQWLDFSQKEEDFYTKVNELIRTLDTDRDHVKSHTKCSQRAIEWQDNKKSKDLLLRGSELAIAEKWLTEAEYGKKHPTPTDLQKELIIQSREAIVAEEKQQKRQVLILRSLLIGVSIALLGAIGASIFAFQQKQEAEDQKVKAQQATQKAVKSKEEAERQATIAIVQKIQTMKSQQEAIQQKTEAQLNQAKALGYNSLSLFNEHKELEAFVEAIRAGKILQEHSTSDSVEHSTSDPVVLSALQEVIYQGSEKNRLEEHHNPVNSVSFSPNGKTLASGSNDNTIKLWNVETGKFKYTINGHNGTINSVSFSPNGKTLASGSADNTIKFWNVRTAKEIRTIYGHTKSVRSVSFSTDGKILASGSDDNTIKLWNVETGKEIRTLSGHTDSVRSVSFSTDGKILASGSDDNTIKLWNVETGKEIRTLSGHTDSVRSVNFSPDGKILASGSADNTIKLWNVETGKEKRTLSGHTDSVRSVSFSPDGKILASGSADNIIKLWNIETGKEIRTLSGHTDPVNSVSFSPDGKTLASGSSDYTIKLWNIEIGKGIRTIYGHTKSVRSVSFSPDGKTLASGSYDKTIKLWNLETDKEIQTIHYTGWINSVSFSPDGKTLASGNVDKTITLWNVKTGKLIYTIKGHKNYVSSVSFSPDGKILASGSADNIIKLWNVKTGKEIRTLYGHTDPVNSVSFSPDGKTLASGSSDKTIKLWNIRTTKVRTLKGHNYPVNSVSFSPDGKTLASGSSDKTIKLWNLETGKEISTLKGHNYPVNSVSFSPDGKTLASGSNDNTIKLWNIRTTEEIRTLSGHNYSVNSVSFSPDGKTLASGSSDKTIKLWMLDPNIKINSLINSLMTKACHCVKSYLQNNPNVSDSDKHLCD